MARFPFQKGEPPWHWTVPTPRRIYSVRKRPVRYRPARKWTYRKLYLLLKYLPSYPRYDYLPNLIQLKHERNVDNLPVDYYWATMCLDAISWKIPRHPLIYWYSMETYKRHATPSQWKQIGGTWSYMEYMSFVARLKWAWDAATAVLDILDKAGEILADITKEGLQQAIAKQLEAFSQEMLKNRPEQVLDLIEKEAEKELLPK